MGLHISEGSTRSMQRSCGVHYCRWVLIAVGNGVKVFIEFLQQVLSENNYTHSLTHCHNFMISSLKIMSQ